MLTSDTRTIFAEQELKYTIPVWLMSEILEMADTNTVHKRTKFCFAGSSIARDFMNQYFDCKDKYEYTVGVTNHPGEDPWAEITLQTYSLYSLVHPLNHFTAGSDLDFIFKTFMKYDWINEYREYPTICAYMNVSIGNKEVFTYRWDRYPAKVLRY